jgi:hypothetical protein
LQANIFTLMGGNIALEENILAAALNLDEVRHCGNFFN